MAPGLFAPGGVSFATRWGKAHRSGRSEPDAHGYTKHAPAQAPEVAVNSNAVHRQVVFVMGGLLGVLSPIIGGNTARAKICYWGRAKSGAQVETPAPTMSRPVSAMAVRMVCGVARGTSYSAPSRKIQNDPPQNFMAQELPPTRVK